MRRLLLAALALFFLVPAQASAPALSQQAAIALAEKFVLENGYTSAGPDRIKRELDPESIEWTEDRAETLRDRHDTLQPRAIGARSGRRGGAGGWSIAFDYTARIEGARDACRVVTMDADGTNIRVEHVDGMRQAFAGFDTPAAK